MKASYTSTVYSASASFQGSSFSVFSSSSGGISKYHLPGNRRQANMAGITFTLYFSGNTSKKSLEFGWPRQKKEVPLPDIITTCEMNQGDNG